MRFVRDIPLLEQVPVLVRAALNVPVENGNVVDDYRLRRALPTIQFLQERGARIILASHIDGDGIPTLAPVAKRLGELIANVSFCDTTVGPAARAAVRALGRGQILVLENLRRNPGEIKNDPAFAKELAALADVFVEDSFDTCHRLHASIVGVPKLLPSYAGLLLEDEIRELAKALSPNSPSLAIIGGAKFSTKEPVLQALLKNYDHVFVGGALANDFIQASGHTVGTSLVSTDIDKEQMKSLLENPKLVLPIDAIVSNDGKNKRVAALDDVRAEEMILDQGPATSALLADLCAKAKTILWNGPLGKYENGYEDATDALALAIAGSSAYSVIGGGDTTTAIAPLKILGKFSFVSTGGGAMLDFLANGTLPGIEALDTKAS